MKPLSPLVPGLAAVLLWSTVATAFKLALRDLRPVELLFWSASVAVAVLALVLVARRRFVGVFAELTPETFGLSATAALLNPVLYYLLLFQAYDRLLAQEAMVLNYLWPVVLTLLAGPLLGRRVGWRGLAALVICFAGAVIVVTRGRPLAFEPDDPAGVLMALGSTVLWALFWIMNMKDTRDEVEKIFLCMLFGLPMIAVATVAGGEGIRLPEWRALGAAVYVGLFEIAVTFVLWLTALARARNTARVASLVYLSPVLSLGWIALVLGEPLYPATGIGLAVILLGLALQPKDTAEEAPAPAPESGF